MNSQKKWAILLDLLGIITDKKKVDKRQIMEQTEIDGRNFEHYFDFLLQEGCISNCISDDGYYMITKNGEKLYQGLMDLKDVTLNSHSVISNYA